MGFCTGYHKTFIELRGIGIIDVKTLFGVESVKDTQSVDLVIKLEEWDRDKEYDRLGLHEEYTEYLGEIRLYAILFRSVRDVIWRSSLRLRQLTTDRRRWDTMQRKSCISVFRQTLQKKREERKFKRQFGGYQILWESIVLELTLVVHL